MALQSALAALAALDDLDLVAVPDAMSLRQADGQPDVAAIVQVQRQMLTHCAEQGDRLAILDAVPEATTAASSGATRPAHDRAGEPVNGALYYPWLRTVGGRLRAAVWPCGGHLCAHRCAGRRLQGAGE